MDQVRSALQLSHWEFMMLTQQRPLQSCLHLSERLDAQEITKHSDRALFQKIMDSFIDGILILTEQGEWFHANDLAHQICRKLTQDKSQRNSVPEEIWRVCRTLLESRNQYSNQQDIMEDEIVTDKLTTLRIRARWLKLSTVSSPYLLVILEDRYQSIQNLAIAEVDKYGLTRREAEVWLLRRANYSRKEIAAELCISLDTVKKHLKNIHAKQEAVLYMEPLSR